MGKTKYRVSEFNLIGELQKTSKKKGKIKYLKLVSDRGEYWIKVSKTIRKNLDKNISKGCRLKVLGQQKQNFKTGKIKLKANSIDLVACNLKPANVKVKEKKVSLAPIFDRQKKVKAKVLICQKNNCWKRGGKIIHDKLTEMFRKSGLENEIEIKKTGCLKKCKQAPNIVMMPDKSRYSKVNPKQVPALVEKHLIV
ncbi:ferredoxin [Myxosarcina sp. GI1]|uniref:(2Fe-2S) ferredoxin domain-containing protein n=1 Tax=Myxosarcina sp. GI1 TaxID=1541065 RepID=UPI00055C7A5D|nr:(2Fe-2S) ferredoxin domain-containing protein [Myxosarcina sp. GI1]